VADYNGGLQVIDISDPTNPTIVGSAHTSCAGRDISNTESVYVSGNYAYVADSSPGCLQVIDITDPRDPTIVGAADTPQPSSGVYVSGGYAYVVAYEGLLVIDISDPTNPTIVGSADTPGYAMGIEVLGNYAYVGNQESGFRLLVIDITDPTNPSIVGSVDTPGLAQGVHVSGNYVYVADSGSGLQAIDVSDPADPTIVGFAGTPDSANDVFVSGEYAYVADYNGGLQVVDVSNPTNPFIVGSVDVLGDAQEVFFSGNYAYVTAGELGLQILRAFEPCTNVTLADSTTQTATVPAGLPAGIYNLHVANPNGERAILHNAFTVNIHGIRVNAGGGDYVDGSGNLWSADFGYNTGIKGSRSDPISGTTDDPLFQSERWDPSASPNLQYSFDVPTGNYTVNLYFADIYGGKAGVGLRVFDVMIEDELVLDDLDIYREVGHDAALIESFSVAVTDGQLNIEFLHKIEDPKISAIEIISQ
jgi:hypothetical protein